MTKTSSGDRRERLAIKKQQIEARLKAIDAKAKTQDRKKDTRRKVIAGALALRHVVRNPKSDFSKQMNALIAHEIATATPNMRKNLERLFADFLTTLSRVGD